MFFKKKILLKSGDGGNGGIFFLKNKNKKIPIGGHGGSGGDIFFLSNCNCLKLNFFYFSKNGSPGLKNNKTGKKGNDLIIKIFIGSKIYIKNKIFFFIKNNFLIKIVKGGKGGAGNYILNFINKNYAIKGKIGKFLFVTIFYKYYIKYNVIHLSKNNFKINNFNYFNNFISKIYLIVFNSFFFNILLKLIKFFLFYLYIKNINYNIYWLIIDINSFVNIYKKIKIYNVVFFIVSLIYLIGINKIKHYLKIWKNS